MGDTDIRLTTSYQKYPEHARGNSPMEKVSTKAKNPFEEVIQETNMSFHGDIAADQKKSCIFETRSIKRDAAPIEELEI